MITLRIHIRQKSYRCLTYNECQRSVIKMTVPTKRPGRPKTERGRASRLMAEPKLPTLTRPLHPATTRTLTIAFAAPLPDSRDLSGSGALVPNPDSRRSHRTRQIRTLGLSRSSSASFLFESCRCHRCSRRGQLITADCCRGKTEWFGVIHIIHPRAWPTNGSRHSRAIGCGPA
jgi:hypothetical protein